MKKTRLLFPALRCRMGDWMYYVTYFKFSDVEEWIKPTDEVHKSQKLSEWIQRRLTGTHTKKIQDYLLNQSERFFNAIVIGVYGGQPEWASLKISVPAHLDFEQLSVQQEEELESSIGLLKFSGEEKLFAIDGQHRVSGIKKALKASEKLQNEEICSIFVGHENTHQGMERTRRLFTTLNKTAKKVSNADIIALDEDDGFAVVTRQLADECEVFFQSKKIYLAGSAAIPLNNKTDVTSIISLYQIAQDLYPKNYKEQNLPTKSEFKNSRVANDVIDKIYELNWNYWFSLKQLIPEYQEALSTEDFDLSKYRSKEKTHLLFRHVGQRAFASSIQLLVSRGNSMRQAIESLSKQNLWLQEKEWHDILWNPIQENIIPKNRVIAETYLLQRIGEEARTKKHKTNLDSLLNLRQ